MLSKSIDDYEILSILGGTLQSTCYKVKEISTSKVYVWKTINSKELSSLKIKSVLKEVEDSKCPSLVELFEIIPQNDTCYCYIVREYCDQNLSDAIDKCNKSEYIAENIIWHVVYVVATTLKTLNLKNTPINIKNVFINKDTVKVLYMGYNNLVNENTLQQLGVILHQLCTLTKTYTKTQDVPLFYSEPLKNLIEILLKNETFDLCSVNSLLHHPIVSKSSSFCCNDVYKKIEQFAECNIDQIELENKSNFETENMYTSIVKSLQTKAQHLKNIEEKLKEREYLLNKREKKVAISERLVKEKIMRADLYLKRCKESKANNKQSLNSLKKVEPNVDTSFSADCGDTSILPTSKKCDFNVINKPPVFVRSISEKRIKFKGHSPLRTIQYTNNIQFNRCNKTSRKNIVEKESSEVSKSDKDSYKTETDSTHSNDTEKRRNSLFKSFRRKSKKHLFNLENAPKNENIPPENVTDLNCKPIVWTEESKRHAFDLLRILNSQDSENNYGDIKHTYL